MAEVPAETAPQDIAGPVGSKSAPAEGVAGAGVAGERGIAGDGGADAARATEEQLLNDSEVEHPEPKAVGAQVVQDNVSEPGVQHTHQLGAEGEILQTSSHDEEAAAHAGEPTEDGLGLDGAAAKLEAEDQGLLPDPDALLGAGDGSGNAPPNAGE